MVRHGWWRFVPGAAGAVLAVAATLTLGIGASAAPALPTLPSLPVTAPPLPSLPLPSLPLPSLPLPSLPLPSLPLPSPAGVPGPLGSPPPTGQPPGGAGAAGAATPAPGASTSGSVPVVQASLFDGLLGLLGTPAGVGVERPSLEHFDAHAALASSSLAPAARGVDGPVSPASALLVGLAVAGLLVVLGVGVTRRHRRRASRLRAAVAGPLLVLAAVMTAAAAQSTLFPAQPVAAPTSVAVANTAVRSPAGVASAATAGSALFNRLVAFETRVGTIQSALQSPPAGQGAAVLRAERTLATTLEAVEQQEYAFYTATAQDPAQAAALVQATAAEPAATRSAVSYDVQAVQAQLAQQAAIAQAAQSDAASTPSLPISGTAPPAAGAPLAWPMGGVITQGFGPSQIAIEPAVTLAGVTYPHFHTGIDISAAFGTPVQAAANGVVALAGSEVDGLGHLVGYGNYVVIAHGANLVTLYGHLERLLVHAGETVHAGDLIGLEGSTGNSTGPHVHFELRVHGVPTDPTGYVRRQ